MMGCPTGPVATILDSAGLESWFLFYPNVPDDMVCENSASGSPSRTFRPDKASSDHPGERSCPLQFFCMPHGPDAAPTWGRELACHKSHLIAYVTHEETRPRFIPGPLFCYKVGRLRFLSTCSCLSLCLFVHFLGVNKFSFCSSLGI